MPNIFAKHKRQIDNFLKQYLHDKKNSLKLLNNWGGDVPSRLAHFATNGKTIRGGLVVFAADAYGVKTSTDVLRVAAAMELIQSGLLIHDDIIDQDRLRRGENSLYVQYEDLAPSLGVKAKIPFGSGMATCVGDVAFFLAMELVVSIQNKTLAATILSIMTTEYTAVCLAQMQDIRFGFSTNIPTSQDVLSVYKYKTARYTFSLPLMIGAMLAEAPQKEVNILEKTGENIGLLFQMQDDMLNLFGISKGTGKSVGSDIRESKKTLAYLFLYSKASDIECKSLNNPVHMYALLEKYEVKKYIDKEIQKLAFQAHNDIKSLNISPDYAHDFHDSIDYIIQRNK